MYCIRSYTEFDEDQNSLYWNNEYGWVNSVESDFFSEEEKNKFNLPIAGYWQLYSK